MQRGELQQLCSELTTQLGSPVSDGHVSGCHHVAQLVALLRLNQACCVSAVVRVCVCRWRLTHSPGQTRRCSGCYHGGLQQLCEHEQTCTHKGLSGINNMTASTQINNMVHMVD